MDQPDLQLIDFLKRAKIKTMKKDLRALREADAVKESEKIVQTKITEKEQSIKEPEEKTTQQFGEPIEILQKIARPDQTTIIQAKEYANETEKQQIFLLESQLKGLENQLQETVRKGQPPILLEKNKILIEQRNWRDKLNYLIKEEEKIETEKKNLEQRESNVPSEKQALEQRKWYLEKQGQQIEKNRWSIERELKKLADRVRDIEENYGKFDTQENELRTKISQINNSLREVYSKIINRVEERRTALIEQQRLAQLKKTGIDFNASPKITEQQTTAPARKEKGYLESLPSAVKERLAQSTKTEEEERKKFLEDTEQWAEEENKGDPNLRMTPE